MSKYTINKIPFKTQSAVQGYAKAILYSVPRNVAIKGADLDFMLDFFATFHWEWENKKGVGVKNIWVVKEPNYGKHNAFEIERIDGSRTDISYIISTIKKKDHKRDFYKALRVIIEDQIWNFKELCLSNGPIYCPFTNKKLNSNNSHVDHYAPTFKELADRFIKENSIKDFEKLLAPSIDNQTQCEIIDIEITKSFYEYHKEKANLRLISSIANLSHAKTGNNAIGGNQLSIF